MLPAQTAYNITQDYSAYIINLSTIHTVAPISKVIDNFAKLHYDYANSWLHFKWYSKLWVSLKYLTMMPIINEYKLGKKNTETFISKLKDIFYFIPPEVSSEKLTNAWNSLITWDPKSTERLNYLINKNQPINLISNTNELNIQQIKQDIDKATEESWSWKLQTEGECQFQVYKNFRLMTSYENGVFKTDGLLEKLVAQLISEGHIREKIFLVSQYQQDLVKAQELGIQNQSADQFFPKVAAQIASQSTALNNPIETTQTQTITPLPSNLFSSSSSSSSNQRLFSKVKQEKECTEKNSSEDTPLISKVTH